MITIAVFADSVSANVMTDTSSINIPLTPGATAQLNNTFLVKSTATIKTIDHITKNTGNMNTWTFYNDRYTYAYVTVPQGLPLREVGTPLRSPAVAKPTLSNSAKPGINHKSGKLSNEIKDGSLTTYSNRLGKYMVKQSIRSTSFVLNKVYPQTFTPNGDNRNDYVEFQFENPTDSNPQGKIFDLRGALVAELVKGDNYNSLIWDGRINQGEIAPPGVYIYQIEVTGTESKVFNGIVILAK